jgi:hypothetical protein
MNPEDTGLGILRGLLLRYDSGSIDAWSYPDVRHACLFRSYRGGKDPKTLGLWFKTVCLYFNTPLCGFGPTTAA